MHVIHVYRDPALFERYLALYHDALALGIGVAVPYVLSGWRKLDQLKLSASNHGIEQLFATRVKM